MRPPHDSLPTPSELVGSIDIYLLDQVLRGRIRPGMRIFDAGCGGGRNLEYFLRAGYEAAGLDANGAAVETARRRAAELAPDLPIDNFRHEAVENSSFPDEWADAVVSIAVLHFAADDDEFEALLRGTWRLLRPGGLLLCRLASDIGMEGRFRRIGERRFELLDGTQRYLVDEDLLVDWTERLGGSPADPIKTTVVQGMRCMTTWVLRRDSP